MHSDQLKKMIAGGVGIVSVLCGFLIAQSTEQSSRIDTFVDQIPRVIDRVEKKNDTVSEPSEISHKSFSMQKDFFDAAYAKADLFHAEPSSSRIILVNHHLLAAHLIADAFNRVATEKHRTVVILSPDHFVLGKNDMSVSVGDWITPYGTVSGNPELVKRISDAGIARPDETPFDYEHGVSGLVPFIKRSLPNATVTPIIFKDSLNVEQVRLRAIRLLSLLPSDALIVASVDIAHYVPERETNFQDEKTIAVLSSLEYDGLRFVNVDSKPVLAATMQIAESERLGHFDVWQHTSNHVLLGQPNLTEGTSYITGGYTQGEQKTTPVATALFLGDMMLDRSVRTTLDSAKFGPEYVFDGLKRFLGGSDLVVFNHEGAMTTAESTSVKNHGMAFTFNPKWAKVLADLGFNVASLANNHSLNFGYTGLAETRKFLQSANIATFGDPNNKEQLSVIKTVRGVRIGIVGYHQFAFSGEQNVKKEIIALKQKTDFVIVMPHWGVEYHFQPTDAQRTLAHEWIDAGADAIIGGHPHTIEPAEMYKGKMIFYSLGNFLFDQTFSTETQQGLGIGLVIKEKSVEYYLFPLSNRNMSTGLLEANKADAMLDALADGTRAESVVQEAIRVGHLVFPR